MLRTLLPVIIKLLMVQCDKKLSALHPTQHLHFPPQLLIIVEKNMHLSVDSTLIGLIFVLVF